MSWWKRLTTPKTLHWSADPYRGVPAPCGATENLTIDGSKVTCPLCRRQSFEGRNTAGEFAHLDHLEP